MAWCHGISLLLLLLPLLLRASLDCKQEAHNQISRLMTILSVTCTGCLVLLQNPLEGTAGPGTDTRRTLQCIGCYRWRLCVNQAGCLHCGVKATDHKQPSQPAHTAAASPHPSMLPGPLAGCGAAGWLLVFPCP
jgi:hypothetical protein